MAALAAGIGAFEPVRMMRRVRSANGVAIATKPASALAAAPGRPVLAGSSRIRSKSVSERMSKGSSNTRSSAPSTMVRTWSVVRCGRSTRRAKGDERGPGASVLTLSSVPASRCWNSSVVFVCGNGASGTGTPSAVHSGSHPLPARYSTRRSGRAVARTFALCSS